MNFLKLKRTIVIDDYTLGDVFLDYGGGKVMKYHKVLSSVDFKQVLPEQYRDRFLVSGMEIFNNVPVHTDSRVKVGINFYIDPGEFETKFWRIKDDDPTLIYNVANQVQNGKVFRPEALEFVESFVAKPGDAYLLDISKPHSVVSSNPSYRFAFVVQTNDYTFDDVANMLVETGYL